MRISPIWIVAKEKSHMNDQSFKVASILVNPFSQDDDLLCEFCGYLHRDSLTHYAVNCYHTAAERLKFWDILTNSFSVEISAAIFNLEDDQFTNVLIGGPCEVITDVNTHIDFMVVSINFLFKLMSKVSLF